MTIFASRDIYDSTTGAFYRAGDPLPPKNEETKAIYATKARRGKVTIPGIDDNVKATATKVAGSDKPNPNAGQDGRKPAKRPAARTVAEIEAVADNAEIEEGGKPRETAPATPSVLD